MWNFLYPILGLGILFLGSCQKQPGYPYLQVNYEDKDSQESAFLAAFFADTEQLEALQLRLLPDEGPAVSAQPVKPDIHLDFCVSWKYEAPLGDIPLSKTWFVPREDTLAGRIDTTLAACRGGTETLIPLAELEPPFVALRVDGLSVEDAGYPLVRTVGIRVGAEILVDTEKQARIQALERALGSAPNPLVGAPAIFWIASGGDLMLDQGASALLFNEGPGGIFGGTAEFLAGADLALVNLEGVVSSRGTKVKKSFNFRFDPKIAEALRNTGIDAVLLANNHAFDYGAEGFLDSLDYLEKAGIGILGAGLDADAAAHPVVFSERTPVVRAFGIASFPREKNGWDGLTVAAGKDKPGLLHAEKGGGELLKPHFSGDDASLDIVLFHGGEEWSRRPNSATRELYKDLIQHGADLIIGSHPHMLQGFEWVLGKPVFWSLGNYMFGGVENTEGREEGLFIMLGFWGNRLVYLEPYPLSLSHTRTIIAPPETLSHFYTLSRELRDSADTIEKDPH
ncbi:MAG: CapA family protein [Treponema sp.]|jgi:poly-gamma-glutamate synthesis protein (capsule biosynthesis protein)|nr:CapA family protein [Treponema sp.]